MDNEKVDDLLKEIKNLKEIVQEKEKKDKVNILSIIDIKKLEDAIKRMDNYERKICEVDFEELSLQKKIQRMEIYLQDKGEEIKDKEVVLEKLRIKITEFEMKNEELQKKVLSK